MRCGAIWDRIPWALKWMAVGLCQVQCAYLLYWAITNGEVWSRSGEYVTYHDHPLAFIVGIAFTLVGFLGFMIALSTILPRGRARPLVDHRSPKPPIEGPEFIAGTGQGSQDPLEQ